MKKSMLMWLLVTGPVLIVRSQIITVRDKETGELLEMATLMSEIPEAFATTNANGQADISAFSGAEKIEIRRVGYKAEITRFPEIEKRDFEILLSASSTRFDEVVISATRWSQTSRDVPSKISIISPKEAVLYNPQTAADLLGSSGEVFIQKSQQGGGSPMIRGFATNRLLYTIDGVRMNSAIFRAGNIQNVISLDPFAVENTEVFFGPGSVIYGSDAIGGVMSFQTLSPHLSLTDKPLITGKAVSRISSANNELTNHFDVNAGGKKWASVTGLTHSRFGDLRMGTKGPDEYRRPFYVQRMDGVDKVFDNPDPLVQNPSGYSQINLMQKIRFSPAENWDIQYGFHYSETSEYARYDKLIEMEKELPVHAVWKYGPQIWMMNNLSVTHHSNKVYDYMTIRLTRQDFEESRIDRKFNNKNNRLRTTLENVQARSINADFEKKINKHRFYYGAEYVLNDVKSTGSAVDISNGRPIPVPDRYPGSKWKSYAGYLNYQFLASKKFLIQAGARFSAFNLKSDFTRNLPFFPFDFTTSTVKNSSPTGSIGAVYSPDETWKISLNASTGFRAPNVDDMGKIFEPVKGEVIVPNPSLKAEYAYNGELSLSKIVRDAVKIDAAGFYTWLDKAMVRRPFQVNGQHHLMYDGELKEVSAVQNASYCKVYGFNAGIEIQLPSGFELSSRYNYQSGKEEMDNGTVSPARHAAPAFGITRLSYKKDKLFMQFYTMYCAKVSFANLNPEEWKKVTYAKDADGKNYSPDWYTVNFKTMYQFHENLSVSAGIENLTDQRYRPYSSGLVAPGRNFILSLRARF